jgi:uncharacterized protein (TIGR02145 family)
MKKLALLFVFVNSLIFAQGEQRYADGTATDQDGNSFEWISYGYGENSFHWAIENADVVTYNDGTPIPQVLYPTEWSNLTSGAWCYYNNDPSQHRLYNWYAVNNPKFAPEGWRVASKDDYTLLTDYLENNNYIIEGGIGKAMASTTGWNSSTTAGAPGNDQNLNNSSGFNAFPEAYRDETGPFRSGGNIARFWTSTYRDSNRSYIFYVDKDWATPGIDAINRNEGISVRFVRDAPNDTQPPVFTLLGANPIAVNQGDTYSDPGATATDNVDGNLTSSIVVSGTVDTNNPGTYIVTYSVTDSAGNTSTVTRTVIVLDTQPPIITILGANPISVNQGDTYSDPGATATDNVDGNLASSIVVSGTVDTNSSGNYNINYNVTDSAGNAANQATRTVVVVETTPTVDAGPDQTICEDETVTLGEATASNVSSVIWTTSGDGAFDNPSIINPTYTPGPQDRIFESFRLTLNAQGSNGQEYSDRATIYITSLPTVNAGSDFAVNEDETIQLSEATVYNYSSSVWTTSGTGVFNDNNILNPIYTPSQQDITNGYVDLIITAISIAPCTLNVIDTVTITINPNPTVEAGPGLSVCQGESVAITGASASNYSSLQWTTSGSGTFINVSTLTPIYTPGAADIASGAVTLTLTANGANGQQASDTAEIYIEQDHIIQLTSSNSDQIVDEGTSISPITFSLGGGATSVTVSGLPRGISLTVVDGGVTISGTPTDDISQPVTYTYEVVTIGNGCTAATYNGTITVYPFEINPTETGILLNGTVSAENNQIKNVADPTDAQDAVTKTFIENFIKNSVSMEFFEWNISKVNADNQTIQLSFKPFVFVNAANTTIILPDESQVSEMDVIYIYSLRGTNNATIEDCAITFTSNSHPISLYKLSEGLITASVGQKIYGRFPSSGLKTIVFIDGQWFIGNFSPYSILD